MDVGSAILHFPPCRPGQAQTGDHAASKEDTDGKKPGQAQAGDRAASTKDTDPTKPGGELEKAGSRRGGVWLSWIVLGASAGSPDVRLTVLHF